VPSGQLALLCWVFPQNVQYMIIPKLDIALLEDAVVVGALCEVIGFPDGAG